MSKDLKAALLSLDVTDDLDWTSDGAPSLLALSTLMGKEITRRDIAAVTKGFSRKSPVIDPPKAKTAKKSAPAVKKDSEEALIEAVEKARMATYKANADLKKATEKLDAFIVAKEREAKRIGPAESIKAYQKSQAAQRAAEAKAKK